MRCVAVEVVVALRCTSVRGTALKVLCGQPTGQVHARLRQHLADRGWRLDASGSGCKPAGWLIDQREVCVELWPAGPEGLRLTLSGLRAWP